MDKTFSPHHLQLKTTAKTPKTLSLQVDGSIELKDTTAEQVAL
jgi:hypothetical protein